jgi:hypothetical protein
LSEPDAPTRPHSMWQHARSMWLLAKSISQHGLLRVSRILLAYFGTSVMRKCAWTVFVWHNCRPFEGGPCVCGVAGALLGAFKTQWAISLHRVPPSPDMAESPLQPVLAVVRRTSGADDRVLAPPVQLTFATDASCPNAEQLQDIHEVQSNLMRPACRAMMNASL